MTFWLLHRMKATDFYLDLSGTTGGEELWRYCITDTDGVVGMALGAMFVREAFQGESKQKVRKFKNISLECYVLSLSQISVWFWEQKSEWFFLSI